MTSYPDDLEVTAETMTRDGFVRTGDLAAMEPDGAFHDLTRMGEGLRLGSYRVSPAEIQSELQRCPAGVAGVRMVSAPVDGADRAVAFAVPRAGARSDVALAAVRAETVRGR